MIGKYLKRGTSERVTVTNVYNITDGSVVEFTDTIGREHKIGKSKFKKQFTWLSGDRIK